MVFAFTAAFPRQETKSRKEKHEIQTTPQFRTAGALLGIGGRHFQPLLRTRVDLNLNCCQCSSGRRRLDSNSWDGIRKQKRKQKKAENKRNSMTNGIKDLFKPDGKNEIHDGIDHAPGGGKALLDSTDTVLLLLDHQSGLFQNVKDISVAELRANTTALAKVATLHQMPVITTASVPDGPNGPLMPEIQEAAPHAVYVPRKGEVNAWDNALFVKTVRATGKKTLVIAGVWTSVCVMFPALDAKAAGFKVYAVMDASGDPSEMASRTTLARFTQAGVIPISANAFLCETHRTWNRPDAAQLAQIYTMVSPNYRAVIESYDKAQSIARSKGDGASTAPRRKAASPLGSR
jgi:nicotinamidase-related amidase